MPIRQAIWKVTPPEPLVKRSLASTPWMDGMILAASPTPFDERILIDRQENTASDKEAPRPGRVLRYA
jgi:hypothetical protein